jgi:Fe-S-cluster containining protein
MTADPSDPSTKPREPWRRISLRVAPARDGLTWSEALTSPCMTCASAPCCTHLTLHEFEVDGITDLDYARYVLNFDRMLLGIKHDGKWCVYYRHPCRHLDREHLRCTVHDTPEQPNVCKGFSPYACWYKASYDGPTSDTLIQIDRVRLDWILERCRFREDRSIEGMPSNEAMREAFGALPVIEDPPGDGDELIAQDTVYPAWRLSAGHGEPPAPTAEHTFAELADPCQGCAAYCCTSLVFPQRAPFNHAQVDYFRYALGFPGIELGVGPAGWSVTVRTRCRHLDGTRCGVYGQPDRPLVCRYYDAHKCGYKFQFGNPRPAGFVRVQRADFDAVIAAFRFTETGVTTKAPTPDEVRAAIEESWRAAAGRNATLEG